MSLYWISKYYLDEFRALSRLEGTRPFQILKVNYPLIFRFTFTFQIERHRKINKIKKLFDMNPRPRTNRYKLLYCANLWQHRSPTKSIPLMPCQCIVIRYQSNGHPPTWTRRFEWGELSEWLNLLVLQNLYRTGEPSRSSKGQQREKTWRFAFVPMFQRLKYVSRHDRQV